jgi:hypothetical protein
MKLNKETLKQIIKEELEAVQQEGFMDSVKGFFGGGSDPAMKGFNQGPSSYNFKMIDEKELQSRKEAFLRGLGQTRVSVRSSRKSGRGTSENYFFGKDVKTGMIDIQQIVDDIKADLAGIDAMGHTSSKGGDLSFPEVIENPSRMADLVGNPMIGWQMLAKYLSGKINRLPVKNKDLFAIQQAYAAKQLG